MDTQQFHMAAPVGTLAHWKQRAAQGFVEDDPRTPQILVPGDEPVLRQMRDRVNGWQLVPQVSGGYCWVKQMPSDSSRGASYILHQAGEGQWRIEADIQVQTVPVTMFRVNGLIPMTSWLVLADRAVFWFRQQTELVDVAAEELLQQQSDETFDVIRTDVGFPRLEPINGVPMITFSGLATIRNLPMGNVQLNVPFEISRFAIETLMPA